MRIGIDVDGVLADFNESFIRRCVAITGRDLFPPRPFDITTWGYPESYGYTEDEVSRVWASIKTDCLFWESLRSYSTTAGDLRAIVERLRLGDDVYFITARPGLDAKGQTERWLAPRMGEHHRFAPHPTVLISSAKGLCARALALDVYIDDRWENCLDVAVDKTRVFLMDRPWNRYTGWKVSALPGDPDEGEYVDAAPVFGLTRVSSVRDMLDRLTVPENVPASIRNTSCTL